MMKPQPAVRCSNPVKFRPTASIDDENLIKFVQADFNKISISPWDPREHTAAFLNITHADKRQREHGLKFGPQIETASNCEVNQS